MTKKDRRIKHAGLLASQKSNYNAALHSLTRSISWKNIGAIYFVPFLEDGYCINGNVIEHKMQQNFLFFSYKMVEKAEKLFATQEMVHVLGSQQF